MRALFLGILILFTGHSFAGIQTKTASELIRIYYSRDGVGTELASFMYCKADVDSKYDCRFLGKKKYYTLNNLIKIVEDMEGRRTGQIKTLNSAISNILTGIGIGVGITLYILNTNSPGVHMAQAVPIGAAVLRFVAPKVVSAFGNNGTEALADLIADESTIYGKGIIRQIVRELEKVLK